jgi:hypothetical protein
MTTTKSIWKTGAYDLLVSQDSEAKPGDLMLVVFASPVDPENEAAVNDAPILAHIDVPREDYDELPAHLMGVFGCGPHSLLKPEVVEPVYGPKLAERILTALFEAAERDGRGMDMDDMPWRLPSPAAMPMMQQVQGLLVDLRYRLSGK